jgi:hypothetical protein
MTASKYMDLKGLLLAVTILPGPMILTTQFLATAQIGAAVPSQIPPPVLPVYAQPSMPEEGYTWTPGYWQWAAPVGYCLILDTFILPPAVDERWTPP